MWFAHLQAAHFLVCAISACAFLKRGIKIVATYCSIVVHKAIADKIEGCIFPTK